MKSRFGIAFGAVVAAFAVAYGAEVLSAGQKSYLRRRYVHHQTEERLADGSTRLIRHFYRGAAPDGVETNVLHAVAGAEQHNPLQTALAAARDEIAAKVAALSESEEARAKLEAARNALVTEVESKRNAAKLASTKAIYQAILDAIEKHYK